MTFRIEGTPAAKLPAHERADRKREYVPIDISLLTQPRPDTYRLDEGDVIGLAVEGVIPFRGPDEPPLLPPVQFPQVESQSGPAIGLPVAVQTNGFVSLPLAGTINVKGLSLAEASERVGQAYDEAEILKEESPTPIVTLIKPRQVTVLVIREDTRPSTTAGVNDRQGAGGPITLDAYKNDVLNALMASGGMPGLQAKNEIQIFRRPSETERVMAMIEPSELPRWADYELSDDESLRGPDRVIPLRVRQGTMVDIKPEDITLREGDIVYIRNRDTEVFYTAGLLPAGEFQLPRDYDIDIFEAMAIAGYSYGTSGNGRTSGLIPQSANVPPTQLFVMRERVDGCEYTVEIDLERAICDPRERLIVKPGDKLLLRHSPCEESVNFGIFTFFTFGIRELFGN